MEGFWQMKTLSMIVIAVAMLAEVVAGQYVTPTLAPPVAPAAKPDRTPVEHGSRPDPGAVRPGNEAGDAPAAGVGELVRRDAPRRIFGLPVNAAILIAGVLVVLLAAAGFLIPGAPRRDRARGSGTYGPPD